MGRKKVPVFLVVVWLSAAVAWSSSLDDARRLYKSGDADTALAEINAVLDSEVSASEKAEALDLLGTIAVDKGYLTMARQAWSRLLDEYPDSSLATDARTKLQLVSALLKTESADTADQPVAKAPAPAPVPAPATPSAPAPSAATSEPHVAPAEPATPASPMPSTPASPAVAGFSSGEVLVAARGKPYDAVVLASDRLVGFLREQGVDARSATSGIPVVEDSQMVLPLLIQKGQQDGAGSVLLLTADYESMQKMTLECYQPGGQRLWKMKISGGTGWKGRPYTKSGITEELYERFEKQLAEKVGEPGLPVTLR